MKALARMRERMRGLCPSIFECSSVPAGFWKIDELDRRAFLIYLSVMAFQWLLTLSSGDLYSPFAYWDGPNYVYAAKTMYDIPKDNPWSTAFRYPRYYFACHLPGFPLVIRFFSFLTFNCYWIGDILAIIFCSCLSIYMFRRLLIAYKCVKDPSFTTLLYVVFPIRYIIYKAVGASEPLFLSYCYGALLFFKLNMKIPMLCFLWGATMTRIEGLSIVGTIGLCYLFKLDILGALWTSLAFLCPVAIAFMHKKKFGSYKAYFMFNSGLIRFPPFYMLLEDSKYEQSVPNLTGSLYMQMIMLIGCLILAVEALPLSIFSIVYLIYNSMLFHIDTYRYALPGYVLCLLIGFDSIWSHEHFRAAVPFLGVVYSLYVISYSTGQITSNRAGTDFLKDVMNK